MRTPRLLSAAVLISLSLSLSLDHPRSGAVDAPAETPKPQYGAVGFDAVGKDLNTKAGDDFFRFANGAWVDRTEIPADKSAYSLRAAITDLTEQRLHELMEAEAFRAGATPSTIESKVGALKPEEVILELGLSPAVRIRYRDPSVS